MTAARRIAVIQHGRQPLPAQCGVADQAAEMDRALQVTPDTLLRDAERGGDQRGRFALGDHMRRLAPVDPPGRTAFALASAVVGFAGWTDMVVLLVKEEIISGI